MRMNNPRTTELDDVSSQASTARLSSLSFPRFRRRRSDLSSTTSSAKSEPFRSPRASLRKRIKRLSNVDTTSVKSTLTTEERRDAPPTAVTIRTSVLGSYEPVEEGLDDLSEVQVEMERDTTVTNPQASCGATSVLQHSFVLCGGLDDIEDQDFLPLLKSPEDPTVQESFECVFATQLEEGLPHDMLWVEDEQTESQQKQLMSPALIHQSRSRARLQPPISAKPKKSFRTGSLVHIATYDPVSDSVAEMPPTPKLAPVLSLLSNGCPCQCQLGLHAPKLDPKDWPHTPLLFRPTPGSGMHIKGVRFANSSGYLWREGESHTWVQSLHKHWGRAPLPRVDLGCPECMLLPINNGNEKQNESLVADFVSPLFEGSILLRLRHANGSTKEPYDDEIGYFAGVNRRYQVVIQGRPLQALPLTELMTGFELNRPCGKLPPKWILKGALKLISFFAPLMQADFDGSNPASLSPLGSTPQMLKVNGKLDMEARQEEPTNPQEALLGTASDAPTTLARARFRKKAFDKLVVHENKEPQLLPSNIYTFEFLQHLLNFGDFSIELGSILGSIPLVETLDGQALQIMAKHEDTRLWSFDLFHELLHEDAVKHDNELLVRSRTGGAA